MTVVQKVVLTIGVVLAIALAGVGVIAATGSYTTTGGECLDPPSSLDGGAFGTGACRRTAPVVYHLPALSRHTPGDTAPLWWFGAAAVVVLTALGLVLARPSVPRKR